MTPRTDRASPIQRQEALDVQVYRALRKQILRGELKDGERLVQDDVAAQMGTSRIPVRDALRKLEHEGLVETDERGTYRVRAFSVEDVDEVYGLRMVLEPHAVRLAVPRITTADLSDLDSLLDDMKAAVASGDRERYVEVNESFHRLIYELAGHRRLVRIIETLWYGMPRTPSRIAGQMERSHGEHIEMLGAIRDGDADLAARLMEDHIRSAHLSVRESLGTQ